MASPALQVLKIVDLTPSEERARPLTIIQFQWSVPLQKRSCRFHELPASHFRVRSNWPSSGKHNPYISASQRIPDQHLEARGSGEAIPQGPQRFRKAGEGEGLGLGVEPGHLGGDPSGYPHRPTVEARRPERRCYGQPWVRLDHHSQHGLAP